MTTQVPEEQGKAAASAIAAAVADATTASNDPAMPPADILGLQTLEAGVQAARAATEVPDPTEKPIGPSKEQVEAWKKQHGRVFATIIAGLYFAYRGIKLLEYQAILARVAQDPQFNGEQAIVDTCILWPGEDEAPDLRGKEGVIPSLAGAIVSASGFETNPEIYEL